MNLEQGIVGCINYASAATTTDHHHQKNCSINSSPSTTNKQDYSSSSSTDDHLLMMTTKGQWTPEEDSILVSSISIYGPGHWTYLARSAGLKRSGKSCRLRWLNYLCPDVKRGNLTLQEQILILHLHCQFGNRWSKIAQHLPGRTDNDIKNYWRTRVEKLARQHFNCHASTLQFREAILDVFLPILTNQLQHQQQQVHPEEEVVLSDEQLTISSSSSRVQPSDYDQRPLDDYCSSVINSSTTDSHTSSDVVPPDLTGSWISPSYPDSYNLQSGRRMLSNYPCAQSVSLQESDLLLPSTLSLPADHYCQPPTSTSSSLHMIPPSSSTIGFWPDHLPCFDDDDDGQYYYCSSWLLGGDGAVNSEQDYYSSVLNDTQYQYHY